MNSPPEPLPSPIDTENRLRRLMPMKGFLATMAFVPIWACTILPLTVTFQLGKTILNTITGGALKAAPWSYKDSGYQVKDTDIKKMSDRTYDIVVLGATGFTGGLAVRHLAKTYGVDNSKVKWAIAGRSQQKLDEVKAKFAKELGIEKLNDIPTIIVDTNQAYTMPRLVQDTRVVATTAGPYSKYGSPVVEFCAKFGTHYVDITGEVSWICQMASMYQDTAKRTGAKIVPFAGHDSIPWDILTMKLEDTLKQECDDDLKEVKFWDEILSGVAGGTLATMVHSIEVGRPKRPDADDDIILKDTEGKKSEYSVKKALPSIPEKATAFSWDSAAKKLNRWTVPFIMAEINATVVSWSRALRSRGSKELVYTEKLVLPDYKTAFTYFTGLTILMTSLLNPFTRSFIKKYLTKPGDGPAMEEMETKNYLLVSGEGIGSKGKRVQGHIYFPKDPGCMETSRMMIEAGLCMALQSDTLPIKSGGFLTPSVALGNTLVQRLVETGTTIKLRVVG